MAFTSTVLLEGVAKIDKSFNYVGNELRGSRYGALDAYIKSTPDALPASELQRIKESSVHVTSIDVFQKIANGSGTARACSGTGTGTTANVNLSYSTISESFKIGWAEHEGNRVKYQEVFDYLLDQKLRSIRERLDIACVAKLEADKAASGGSGTVFPTVVADAKRVALADHDTFYNGASVEMEQNDFFDDYMNVASTAQKQLMRFDAAQGGGNSINHAPFVADYDHKPTNRITDGAGVKSTSYLFSSGTVAIVPWVNSLSRAGKDIGSDVWMTMIDPVTGIEMELKIKKACEDNSGSFAGAQADYTESFVIVFEYALLSAYSSTTNTGIYKYELLTT